MSLYGAKTSDTSGSGTETPGKFWNVVLEKDGENQLDRSCGKLRSINEYPTYNKMEEGKHLA